MSWRFFLIGGLLLFAVGALLLVPFAGHSSITALRWAGLLLFLYGVRKRSLTYWILFAMFFGLELGVDGPQFAGHLRFLSDIFLRLIKVIVAPLLGIPLA